MAQGLSRLLGGKRESEPAADQSEELRAEPAANEQAAQEPAPQEAESAEEAQAEAPPAQAASGSAKDRIAAILKSPEAKGRTQVAQTLALETDLPADEAIKVLAKTPKEDEPGGLARKMSKENQPDIGAGGGQPGDEVTKLANQIRSAGKRLRGET